MVEPPLADERTLTILDSALNQSLYCPREAYNCELELYRYRQAGINATQHSQFLSWCGPDATKIGTDLNVLMAAVYAGNTKLAVIANPMVAHDNDDDDG
eukprot:12429416-Karenia_brevis.AAC.1